jgi:hypothetical protein
VPLLFGYFLGRRGVIVPLHGIQSKTSLYRFFYTLLGPVLALSYRLFPRYVTTPCSRSPGWETTDLSKF